MSTLSHLVPPAELAKVQRLDVVARIIVEGAQSGAHRSPLRGASVDFADHRQYVPGDDLRHLDWKVLGRSDRLVLKRYEAETDLGCTLAVDGSGSMAYSGTRSGVSKFRYAAMLSAAVAHLVLQQQDRAALMLYDERAALELPARHQGQLERICRALEGHTPHGATDASKGLEHLSAPGAHRGLVVMLSDCLAPPEDLASAFDRLRARGHDLVVVWILDPDELDLGIGGASRFQGLESEGELVAEPRALATAYIDEVARHRVALASLSRSRGASLVECRTDEPLHVPLNRLLVALNERAR
ncbi:MAG: DUF58 domain-containing protein [Planctomycetota bacterium]